MEVNGIQIGLHAVKASEVQSTFVAYWNGRKWVHGAMKYAINIHTWIKL
jgi:hypothetical protein